jgi:hypothetical protein
MSQPLRTSDDTRSKINGATMFRPIDKDHWIDPSAATHIALPPKTVSALRDMIYESPLSVWESRLSFTEHLQLIDIPLAVHGALYRLMAAKPGERLGCVDLVDIDLMLDGHLSLFATAAADGRERQAYEALRCALTVSNVKPMICGFVSSASDEYIDIHKYCEACDVIDSFDQVGESVRLITTNVFDEAPSQCAYRFELWVASQRGPS